MKHGDNQGLASRFAALCRMIRQFRDRSDRRNQCSIGTIGKPEGFDPIRIPVAGVMYHSPQMLIHTLNLSEPLWLRREANEFDANAVSVETSENFRLGYVGRTVSAKLAPYMDGERKSLPAVITELTRDVSGETVGLAVSLYLPACLVREIRSEARTWGFHCYSDTGGIAYLYLDCDEADLEQVNNALRNGGFPWRRSGLSYRPAPNGQQYRWYVRFDGEALPSAIQRVLEDILGPSREAASARAVDGWVVEFDQGKRDGEVRIESLEQANRALRQQIAFQTGRADAGRTEKLPARNKSNRREFGDAVRVLLPEIHLLNDSLEIITEELKSSIPVLRELHSLCRNPAEIKGERVEGAPQWKERHFSTGQKDDGRLYYRNDGITWHVLISFKGSQKQDINYLRTHRG